MEEGAAEIAANEPTLIAGRAALEDGRAQLATAGAALAAGGATLDAGAAELESGRQQLAQGEAAYAAGQAKIADGQAQVDAGRATLAEEQAKIDEFGAGVTELTGGLGVSELSQVPAAIEAAQAQIDVSELISAALAPYLTIVVGLSLVLLLLVFRSLAVPLLATVGFLLSLAAAFGVAVAVYQWGWLGALFGVHNPGPILSFLPILLTGILFGLAMDYQVFLVTAMREAYLETGRARKSVRTGFAMAAPVVVAAALIMVSVFAGFIFSGLAMIRPLGFGLAMGVLFDAFLVRMTFVPAVMQILGDKAWYLPKWLSKVLPKVDVEGAGLS